MTLFHTTAHHAVSEAKATPRKIAWPAWTGRVAWARIAALTVNVLLWAVIVAGVRALMLRF